MKLLGVDHINMKVSNIAEAVKYYEKLGLVVQGTLDGGQGVFLWNGDPESPVGLELHQTKPGEKPGIGHIAFLVDDVKETCQEANKEGIKFRYGPFYQPRTGRDIAGFDDPDGFPLQFARKLGHGEYEDFK